MDHTSLIYINSRENQVEAMEGYKVEAVAKCIEKLIWQVSRALQLHIGFYYIFPPKFREVVQCGPANRGKTLQRSMAQVLSLSAIL